MSLSRCQLNLTQRTEIFLNMMLVQDLYADTRRSGCTRCRSCSTRTMIHRQRGHRRAYHRFYSSQWNARNYTVYLHITSAFTHTDHRQASQQYDKATNRQYIDYRETFCILFPESNNKMSQLKLDHPQLQARTYKFYYINQFDKRLHKISTFEI